MTRDEQVEATIEEKYRSRPWLGSAPIEDAIQDAIQYRRTLSPEERAMYDDAILNGWYPERAMETVEYAAGRDNLSQARTRRVVSQAS